MAMLQQIFRPRCHYIDDLAASLHAIRCNEGNARVLRRKETVPEGYDLVISDPAHYPHGNVPRDNVVWVNNEGVRTNST